MVSIEKWRKSEDKSGRERKKHRVLLEFLRRLLQHPLQPPPLRSLFSFLRPSPTMSMKRALKRLTLANYINHLVLVHGSFCLCSGATQSHSIASKVVPPAHLLNGHTETVPMKVLSVSAKKQFLLWSLNVDVPQKKELLEAS